MDLRDAWEIRESVNRRKVSAAEVVEAALARIEAADPVLRAFLTYASWSDGLRGMVGGTPYQNKTNGLTYGVQAEAWW